MTRRKHVWLARSLLALIPLSIVVGLWEVPNRSHHRWILVGRAHNLFEAMGIVVMYGVCIVAVAAVVIFVVPTVICGMKYVWFASQGDVDRAVATLKWWASSPHESVGRDRDSLAHENDRVME